VSPAVLFAPVDVAGVTTAYVAGLRELGVKADAVVSWRSPYEFGGRQRVLRPAGRAAYAVAAPFAYDVLHYQFGQTLVPRYPDARWARLLRRTTVVTYHGDDCRLYGVAQRHFPARGRAGDARTDAERADATARLGPLVDAALVADLELATYVAPAFRRVYVTPLPLHSTGRGEPRRPADTPVVLHAASDSVVKGTDAIRRAVAEVARRRPLEFRTLSGVSHAEVAAALDQADVVVDQLNSATSGVFALEAMRRGLPVLGEYQPDALAPYQQSLPVVRVTAETLADELDALLGDAERRERVGAAGIAYTTATHGLTDVARTALAIYAHTRAAPPGVYEATRDGIRAFDAASLPRW
jgi:glycosyltransferase involved in cell wall biosynthesis